jgi:arginase
MDESSAWDTRTDIDGAAEVVAVSIAEFMPRQLMHLQQIIAGFPPLGPRA